MRDSGQRLAVMVRRILARLVARRDILGLTVAGGHASNLTELRVLVRLRGRAALDGGALLALGRSLRRILNLPPGAGMPLLVIRLAGEGQDRDDADRCGVTGRGWESQFPGRLTSNEANPVAARIMEPCSLSVALKRKGRRSRSPPSPWSVAMSACG